MSEFSSSSIALLQTNSNDLSLIEHLKSSMDTPMNGSLDPSATLTYFQEKPYSFVVLVDDTPAALFGIDQNLRHSSNHWFTSTLVFDTWRGKGLNLNLKRAIASTAVSLKLPLGIIIRDWNVRSLKAASRAFPEVTPKKVDLVQTVKGDTPESNSGWIYDLCSVSPNQSAINFRNLEESLGYWWSLEIAKGSRKETTNGCLQTFPCGNE